MLTPKDIETPGAQKCPKCGKQTMMFYPEQNTLRCTNCGFQKSLQQ